MTTQSTPDALRDALESIMLYGEHDSACRTNEYPDHNRDCTCGYTGAMAAARQALSAPPVLREGPEGSGACLTAPGSRVCDPQPASLSSPVGADPSRRPTYEQLLEYVEGSALGGCATAISLVREKVA